MLERIQGLLFISELVSVWKCVCEYDCICDCVLVYICMSDCEYSYVSLYVILCGECMYVIVSVSDFVKVYLSVC